MRVSIKDGDHNIIVGHIFDRIFYKKIIGSVDINTLHNSICIDSEAFKELIEDQCDMLRVFDKESSTLYSATPTRFRQYGMDIHPKGERTERTLSLPLWEKVMNYTPKK